MVKYKRFLESCSPWSKVTLAVKEKLQHVPFEKAITQLEWFWWKDNSVIVNYVHFYIVRDIATAIKDLLDAVNEVFKNCQSVGKMAQYKEVNYV